MLHRAHARSSTWAGELVVPAAGATLTIYTHLREAESGFREIVGIKTNVTNVSANLEPIAS